MQIILTAEESEKMFYDSLCNALSTGVLADYGLQLVYEQDHYLKAKEDLLKELPDTTPCREDIWMRILKNGESLSLVDMEGEEKPGIITLNDVHERVQKTPVIHLLAMENGEDDANTADAILQTVFLGDIIYG